MSMKPKGKKNYLGVEIEFISFNRDKEVSKILHKHIKSMKWDLGSDGSIDPHLGLPSTFACEVCDYGISSDFNRMTGEPETKCVCPQDYELRLLLEESKIEVAMKELKTAFDLIKPWVNETCGLHVHVDSRNRDPRVLFSNLVGCQELFFKMQNKMRSNNDYCMKNEIDDFQGQIENGERYSAINALSYEDQSTIEVRLHEGCVDPALISAWLQVLKVVANKNATSFSKISDIKGFKKSFEITKKDESYMKKQIKKYAKAV